MTTKGEDVLLPGDWVTVEPKKASREVYIAYLRMKVDEEDWHGVADAACDLRELDAVARATELRVEKDPRAGTVTFVDKLP